ncbi:hypothetical protein [Pseudomonas veronii]|nr:hypothetical protein [Pseudomonas veronii]MCT9825586.1 hypothetical protein [Pseudomonas veronii]
MNSSDNTLIGSLQNLAQVVEYADDDGIPDLLQPGYRVERQV